MAGSTQPDAPGTEETMAYSKVATGWPEPSASQERGGVFNQLKDGFHPGPILIEKRLAAFTCDEVAAPSLKKAE
jgi:hypothetical protein